MDLVYNYGGSYKCIYIEKFGNVMKNYIIKMKNTKSEEYKIQNKAFVTFPEAVSHAYIQRATMGSHWEIISVARLHDVS